MVFFVVLELTHILQTRNNGRLVRRNATKLVTSASWVDTIVACATGVMADNTANIMVVFLKKPVVLNVPTSA